MPYKTSSEATRRDSQAVVDDLGLTTLDVPITAQVDAYFATVGDCFADAAGQQVCPRANDRAVRSKRRVRGPGDRHQQQDRVAVGLRHPVRRHGLGHQSDRRPVQVATARFGRVTWACPARFSTRSPAATCGSARPTKANWDSRTPKSIACWCCWSTAAGSRRSSSMPASRRVRRARAADDPPQPVQAPPAGDRQAHATARWTATFAIRGIGELDGPPGRFCWLKTRNAKLPNQVPLVRPNRCRSQRHTCRLPTGAPGSAEPRARACFNTITRWKTREPA